MHRKPLMIYMIGDVEMKEAQKNVQEYLAASPFGLANRDHLFACERVSSRRLANPQRVPGGVESRKAVTSA